MANRRMIVGEGLQYLESTDVEGVGHEWEDPRGAIYRWVKNVSATALVRNGACLKNLRSNWDDIDKYVRSVDTTTAATAQLSIPAGVPMTAIAASGGDCFGWIQVEGLKRVNMVMSDTTAAASGWPGRLSIATNLPATAFWDVPIEPTATSAAAISVYTKGVRLMAQLRPGTASTVRSASVMVECK
jgi:hypothetical protein